MPDYLITAPNGTKYRVTAPEGASQDDVMKYVQSQHPPTTKESLMKSNPEEYDSSSPQYQAKYGPTGQNSSSYEDWDPVQQKMVTKYGTDFSEEGFGSGVERVVRKGGNLLVHALNKILPNRSDLESTITGDKRAIKGGWFSDEALKAQDEIDKSLASTTSGSVGQAVGSNATTLPLTMGAGSALGAARALPYAGRVLANPFTRRAVEGATGAAVNSGVDETGKAATEGAVTNTLLHGAGSGLTRTIEGIVKKSQATQDLEHMAEQTGRKLFVPVAQAGDENADLVSRGTQALYKEGLPLIPGVSAQVKSQSKQAMNVVREMAMSEADPTGTIVKAGMGQDGLEARRALKDAFEQEYDNTVKSYTFNVPSNLKSQIQSRIKASMPNVDDTTLDKVSTAIEEQMGRFSSGQPTIAGENILNAKNAANAIKLSNPVEKEALKHGTGVFDDIIENDLRQGGNPSNIADLQKYQGLETPMQNFQQVSKAINAAKPNSGRFSPAQLANASEDPGTLLHLGTTANEVLGSTPVQPSTAGKVLAYSLGGYGAFTHPAAGAAGIAGANLLATKTVQRMIMGDTAAQKAVTKMLQAHPEMTRTVEILVRNAMATEAGRETQNAP